jgi:drug/metabolite transporter (DMT)-like permease
MSIGAYCHAKFYAKIKPFDLDREMIWLLVGRGFWGTLAFLFELVAVYLMPISLAIVLYFTSPVTVSVCNFLFN